EGGAVTSPSPLRSIPFRDLGGGREDVAVAVRLHEVAVGNLDGTGVLADEDVHPEEAGPQRPHLHAVQALRLAQRADHPAPDPRVQLLPPLPPLVVALLALLGRFHRISPESLLPTLAGPRAGGKCDRSSQNRKRISSPPCPTGVQWGSYVVL